MRSSFFTGPVSIGAVFVLGIIFIIFDMKQLAAFAFILAAISLISWRWALVSLKCVSFRAESSKTRMFPDETFTISMTAENRKNLPLVWLDAVIPLEYNCAVMPVDEMDVYKPDGLTKADDELPRCPMLRERFAFIMPWQKINIDVEMKAVRRGIYTLDKLRLYSGDGFGLAQAGMTVAEAERVFAVYPRRVNIKADMFLRSQWMSTGRSKGYMEDQTLIRGSRDYQPTDSWKRINWRMAARGLPLTVNLPDMILPQSSLFIVDGESFNGIRHAGAAEAGAAEAGADLSGGVWDSAVRPDDEGFELMLSILASIIIRLDQAGLGLSLSLPDSMRSRSVTYLNDTPVSEMLVALSAYERILYVRGMDSDETPADTGSGKVVITDSNSISSFRPLSVYDAGAVYGACESAGKVYFLTKSVSTADNPIINRLNNSSLVVMTMDDLTSEETGRYNGQIVPLKSLLRR